MMIMLSAWTTILNIFLSSLACERCFRPYFSLHVCSLMYPGSVKRVLKTGQSYKTRGHHSVDTTPSRFPYSPLNVCGSLLNFVSFFSKLKFRPFSSSSMFFLVSCSFSSIIAICLAKSNWFLGPFCCGWDSFSLRSTISLSLPIRVSLRKAFSFSLAVKI